MRRILDENREVMPCLEERHIIQPGKTLRGSVCVKCIGRVDESEHDENFVRVRAVGEPGVVHFREDQDDDAQAEKIECRLPVFDGLPIEGVETPVFEMGEHLYRPG